MEPCCEHIKAPNAYAKKHGFMYQLNNTCAFMEIGHCFHDEASVKAFIKKAWNEGRGGIIGTLTTNQKPEREVAKRCGFVELCEVKNDYFGHHNDKYKVGLFFLDLKQPGYAKLGKEVFWLFKDDPKPVAAVPAPVVAPVPVVAPPPPPVVQNNIPQVGEYLWPPRNPDLYAQPNPNFQPGVVHAVPDPNGFNQVQVQKPQDLWGGESIKPKGPKSKILRGIGGIARRGINGKKNQVPKV